MEILDELYLSILEGNAEKTKSNTESALYMGFTTDDIMNLALFPAMKKISKEFKMNEIAIPEVLMSSRAMHASLYVLKPLFTKGNIGKGRVVIGTVAGDLHDIGKNIVSMMLQFNGYEVIDIGIDVMANDFVASIKKYHPDVIAISALLSTTMYEIENIICAINEENLRDNVYIVIGGSPITQAYANKVGADGYGKDSYEAVEIINQIMNYKPHYIDL